MKNNLITIIIDRYEIIRTYMHYDFEGPIDMPMHSIYDNSFILESCYESNYFGGSGAKYRSYFNFINWLKNK